VLRSMWDLRVWRTVRLALLIDDIGHLCPMSGQTLSRDILQHRGLERGRLGNVPWVYAGVTLKICFRTGVGLDGSRRRRKQPGTRRRRSPSRTQHPAISPVQEPAGGLTHHGRGP